MEKQKKGLDKTSIVMLAIFLALIIGAVVLVFVTAKGKDNQKQDENVETRIDQTGETDTEKTEVYGYETYEEIADKFMKACEEGDVETMYSLYYEDLLEIKFEQSGATREEYNEVMKDNMLHITSFEEYPYGEGDLIMNTPAGYVNELFYRGYGMAFPYGDVEIQDCVDIRAYFSNGAFIDFMVAQIDGLWYAVV